MLSKTKTLLRKTTSLPRRIKTKKKTLISTISYEATAELIGIAYETIDTTTTNIEYDVDISEGDIEEGLLQDTTLEDINRNCSLTSLLEEIGTLNLLLLSNSTPNTPPLELPTDEDRDSLFVPEAAAKLS